MFRAILFTCLLVPALVQAQTVTKRLSGLDEPWAIGFLPSGGILVTERAGRLLLVSDGRTLTVSGVPRVADRGQGGLLDVVVAQDFAETSTIFLTYAEPVRGGARAALASARLDEGSGKLSDLKVLFAQEGPRNGGRHFGSRVVEAPDGSLFVTVGDRGVRNEAQNTQVHSGKVVRVSREGAVPSDNPQKATWLPEIWSTGHRNPQGAALDGQGRLWTVEHGARGGDEINRPEAGLNYGWPRISFGVHYSGERIGEGTQAPGLEQPAFYWDPSIAPSGMMIYSGKLWPDWEGDIFVGSLKFDMISRLEVSGDTAREVERLFQDEYNRIRDVREAPDGSIWFLAVGDGAAYQITP